MRVWRKFQNMIKQLCSLLKDEPLSYNRYNSEQLKVIGFENYKHSDCIVKNKMSYSDWIFQKDKFPVIKIEGIEDIKKVMLHFPKCKNIHMFVHQKSCRSFNWHTDNVTVFLFVLKGRKVVHIKSRKIVLTPGKGVIIPKGHLHKVFSNKGTWALSIGYQ